MGRVLAFIACAYVLVVVLPAVFMVGPASLALLLLLAGIVLYSRAGRRSGAEAALRPAAESAVVRELEPVFDPTAAQRRIAAAIGRLGGELREDPLDDPQLVAVLAALLHEPPEERARVEGEYRSFRARLVALRTRAEGVVDAGGQRGDYEAIDAELGAIDDYVEKLRERAAEAEALPDRALAEATRAGEAIAAAREELSVATPALSERLEAASDRHREAWAALEKGRERPATACRLAAEAAELADGVRREAGRIAALPKEIDRRLAALDAAVPPVARGLERVRDELETMVESYAPACWQEIGGAGHAAEHALARARELAPSAARLRTDQARLEEAAAELDEAEAALEEAKRLIAAIERHAARLEAAALHGRDRLATAEREVDRAASAARGGDAQELLRRAGELTARARADLANPRPDWLTISDLADRSLELARLAQGRRAEARDRVDVLRHALDDARTRAERTRHAAASVALIFPDVAERLGALVDEAERAYQAAVRADTAAGDEPDGLEAAIAEYEAAERAAAAFCSRAEGADGPLHGARVSGRLAFSVVWESSGGAPR